MSTASGDPFAPVYHLLSEIQRAHAEMAGMVAGYGELIEQLEERPDPEKLRLARTLPGARYHVATTYVREAWLKLEAELSVLFPQERD
ncbi:MAG: hypothetical protein AB7V42_09830 [Thermoleophilia bacterium]